MHDGAIQSVTSRAWEDLVAMFRQMFPVLAALGCVYVIATMCWFIAPLMVPSWVGRYMLRMLMFAGLAWSAAPFYVALHRFVAFREVRWLPSLQLFNGPAQIYSAYAALSMMLFFMPFIGREIFSGFGLVPLGGLAFVVLVGIGWAVLVRVATLLPMAALDPEQASWQRALEQSKGRTLSYFVGLTMIATPPFVVLMILNSAASNRGISWPLYFPLAILALLLVQLLPLAAATHLYRERAEAEALARR